MEKGRDIIITVYIVMVTAYLGVHTALGNAKASICLSLFLLSVFLAFVLVENRRWQKMEAHAIQLLQYLQAHAKDSPADAIRAVQTDLRQKLGLESKRLLPSRRWIRDYYSGIEYLAVNTILVLSFLPFFYSMTNFIPNSTAGFPQELVFLAAFLVYIFLVNILALIYLQHSLLHSLWPASLLNRIQEISQEPAE
jgi:hypothetical protein